MYQYELADPVDTSFLEIFRDKKSGIENCKRQHFSNIRISKDILL